MADDRDDDTARNREASQPSQRTPQLPTPGGSAGRSLIMAVLGVVIILLITFFAFSGEEAPAPAEGGTETQTQ